MKFPNWPKKHKFLTSLALIVLAILGFFVYLRIDLELNKRAFMHASEAIDMIYADIVKEIGPPDDSSSRKSCGGFLGVYGEGPLSCYLDINFIYPVKDKARADALRSVAQTMIKESGLFIPQLPPDDSTRLTQNESSSAPVTDYLKTHDNIQCTTDYIYSPTFDPRLRLKNTRNKVFYISISCSGPARAKYF